MTIQERFFHLTSLGISQEAAARLIQAEEQRAANLIQLSESRHITTYGALIKEACAVMGYDGDGQSFRGPIKNENDPTGPTR